MKKLMINSMKVCSEKCVLQSDRDYINTYEKGCLSKCVDKYMEVYFKGQQLVVQALPD